MNKEVTSTLQSDISPGHGQITYIVHSQLLNEYGCTFTSNPKSLEIDWLAPKVPKYVCDTSDQCLETISGKVGQATFLM